LQISKAMSRRTVLTGMQGYVIIEVEGGGRWPTPNDEEDTAMDIKQVEALPIVGNAHNDQHIFNACDSIINGDYPMDDKIRAIRKIDQTIGESSGELTEKDVEDYIASC